MMDCRNCSNKSCYINKHCGPTWLQFVEEYKVRKYYSKDSIIFSEGEVAAGIYVVCSGGVRIMMDYGKNNHRLIRYAGKGQILGHRGLSTEMVYPISAVTIGHSELAYIPNEMFFRLLKKNMDLNFYLLLFFADELAQTERRFKIHQTLSDEVKIAQALCSLTDAFGFRNDNIIDYEFQLNDFSTFAGTKSDKVRKVLIQFSDNGLLSMNNTDIRIIQEVQLRVMAGDRSA